MSKLQRWLRGEDTAVAKGIAQVEAAFKTWVAEVAEQYDLYEDGDAEGAYEPKRYSISRLGETSRGALWCAYDWYWGEVYIIEAGNAAEVVMAKSKDAKVVLARDDVLELAGSIDDLAESPRETVEKWANGEPEQPDEYRVLKADAEQRYTLGVAYPVDEIDSHGDFTDAAELEQAAWEFAKNVIAKSDPGVGTDHKEGTDGAAQVVESYIYRGPQWVAEDGTVIAKEGDWLVGAIWTEEAWARVQKDELTGWSIQGLAFRDDTQETPDGD